jgi:hypothetical protein
LSDEKSQVELGAYPQVLLPEGDRRRDLGEGQPAYLLRLLAQKGWDKWTLGITTIESVDNNDRPEFQAALTRATSLGNEKRNLIAYRVIYRVDAKPHVFD